VAMRANCGCTPLPAPQLLAAAAASTAAPKLEPSAVGLKCSSLVNSLARVPVGAGKR
jgi:hypothetical protein